MQKEGVDSLQGVDSFRSPSGSLKRAERSRAAFYKLMYTKDQCRGAVGRQYSAQCAYNE